MQLIKTVSGLREFLDPCLSENKTIGFVPTMGALHEGHLSLVSQCVKENDVCVVSIFVNPTQFNDKNDLLKYPRTEEQDCKMLEKSGCNIVFMPSADEVYPEPDVRIFDFGMLDKVMEGYYRPGHFNGVAQVVSRLFDMVRPAKAYFGEKDFQQLAIIRTMVKMLNYPVEIIPCPIVRELDGLAMSSRNMRLDSLQRLVAPAISRTLFESRNQVKSKSVAELKDWVVQTVNGNSGLEVEYFDIVDGSTLQAVSDWNETDYIVGCIAVFCGEIRLIDNITYKK